MHKSHVGTKRSRRASSPIMAPLPAGIPTFSFRQGLHVWQRGDKPVALLFDDWDIFWVQEGTASWTLQDGSRLVAGPDEFALLPPWVIGLVREAKAPLKFRYCHFRFRLGPPDISVLSESGLAQSMRKTTMVPMSFSRAQAPGVWRAYRALSLIDHRTARNPWAHEMAIIGLIGELATFAHACAQDEKGDSAPVKPTSADARVANLVRRIDAEPAFAWRVSDLARSAGVSAGHLHAMFRRTHGLSLKRYIICARLRLAVKLLKEPRHGRLPAVREVSEDCGFSSQHFFSRQFTAFFRTGPRAFRDGQSIA
jgi:AraC-like DNA-binding protein